jgi:hypothetical protein
VKQFFIAISSLRIMLRRIGFQFIIRSICEG